MGNQFGFVYFPLNHKAPGISETIHRYCKTSFTGRNKSAVIDSEADR
jgi:hypothetical protein